MQSGPKKALFGLTLSQIDDVVRELDLPKYIAKQIADWLYKKDITDIDQMTNLSKKVRDKLSESFEMGLSLPVNVQESKDGTKKYLYPALNGKFIETAYIPDRERHTLCVSSQVGCKMGCLFCMTAKQGFQGSLSAGAILNQIRSLPERHLLTNIVYMGMGEPFDNLNAVLDSLEILTSEWGFGMSPRRITVSTIGVIPAMQEFLEKSSCHLAVSLHSPFEEERRRIMPIEKAYPLPQVLQAIRNFPIGKQRRVSFEYIVFKDLNHSPRHVKELARLLNGIRCRINLLRFHTVPGSPFVSPNETEMNAFKSALEAKGIVTTIRKSRGQDIYAACGLLSTLNKTND